MKHLADHLDLVDSLLVSNVWLLTDAEGRRFLIDTGVGIERWPLRSDLRRAGIRHPSDLTAILLTHRHSDHAGNAVWLRERFRCPIVCHRNDAEILSGRRVPARLRRGRGGFWEELLCRYEDSHVPRLEVDEAIGDGPWKYGFRIIPAFGHTEGSVFIYHEPTRTLFSGDAILTGPPPSRKKIRLSLAIPAFSLDVDACHTRAISLLQSPLPIDHLASGHGPYLGGDLGPRITRFLAEIEAQRPHDPIETRGDSA